MSIGSSIKIHNMLKDKIEGIDEVTEDNTMMQKDWVESPPVISSVPISGHSN